MIILGIDPGSRLTGYGVLDLGQGPARPRYIESGCIRTRDGDFHARLGEIYRGVRDIIARHSPSQVAVEQVFVARNPATALKLGQARGAAIAAIVTQDLPVFEYAPRLVKQSIVGTGKADKSQIQHMVANILSLQGVPGEDAADALAIALCHINTACGPMSYRAR